MMWSIMFSLIKMIVQLLKYPFYALIILIAIFSFLISVNIVVGVAKGKRFKKGQHNIVKKKSFFRRIFIDFPKRFTDDLFDKDPEFFKYQGLIIFEGRQGSGKTMSMVEFIKRMQEEYPLAKTTTNFGLKSQNKELKDWRMLIDYKNDKQGVIVGMDELQNWFSSNDSKNFPPEMLGIVTQNRKNRRIILGTSQNFYLLAKAIRSQATEVRRCSTFFGCLTVVKRVEPILDSEGNVQEWKNRGMYFFVHSKELRNAYDTYKVIENLRKSGFKEQAQDINNNTTIVLRNDKKGKK
mgnify:CR=1 FL=1